MAKTKHKKRQHSPTVTAKRQLEQEKLADEKDRAKKRMDPTARLLLYSDLVFLAVFAILDANGLVSELVNGLSAILGAVLLLAALWFQFGKKDRSGPKQGPKL